MEERRLFTVLQDGQPTWIVLAANEAEARASAALMAAYGCGCCEPTQHFDELVARPPTAPERHHFEERARSMSGPHSEAGLVAMPLPAALLTVH